MKNWLRHQNFTSDPSNSLLFSKKSQSQFEETQAISVEEMSVEHSQGSITEKNPMVSIPDTLDGDMKMEENRPKKGQQTGNN